MNYWVFSLRTEINFFLIYISSNKLYEFEISLITLDSKKAPSTLRKVALLTHSYTTFGDNATRQCTTEALQHCRQPSRL